MVKVCSAMFIKFLYVLCLYKAQISGERLQDHWSSGFKIALKMLGKIGGITFIPWHCISGSMSGDGARDLRVHVRGRG